MEASGRFTIARFESSAVVLDAQTRSIFEMHGDAATAFDVLCDLQSSLPSSAAEADRVRTTLRRLRHELLGEAMPPREGAAPTRSTELYVTHLEPTRWTRRDAFAETCDALVRVDEGVLVVRGAPETAAETVLAFRKVGAEAVALGTASLESDPPAVMSCAWGDSLPLVGTWTIAIGRPSEGNLVVTRLVDAAALLRLLSMVPNRPGSNDLKVLASCAVTVPHFEVLALHDGVAAAIEHIITSHDSAAEISRRDGAQRTNTRLGTARRGHRHP